MRFTVGLISVSPKQHIHHAAPMASIFVIEVYSSSRDSEQKLPGYQASQHHNILLQISSPLTWDGQLTGAMSCWRATRVFVRDCLFPYSQLNSISEGRSHICNLDTRWMGVGFTTTAYCICWVYGLDLPLESPIICADYCNFLYGHLVERVSRWFSYRGFPQIKFCSCSLWHTKHLPYIHATAILPILTPLTAAKSMMNLIKITNNRNSFH